MILKPKTSPEIQADIEHLAVAISYAAKGFKRKKGENELGVGVAYFSGEFKADFGYHEEVFPCPVSPKIVDTLFSKENMIAARQLATEVYFQDMITGYPHFESYVGDYWGRHTRSLTVIAHFCHGKPSPFPESLEDISAEGNVYFANKPNDENGGVIVASFETDNREKLIEAFREHLADHDLTCSNSYLI